MANDKPLPYGRQQITDADVESVVACLRGDWLTQGPRIDDFEAALCVATGAKYAVAVSNGTAALHLATLALGLERGDQAVTSAITFVASANCVRYVGGSVAFADIDPATGLINVDHLEQRVGELVAAGRPPRLLIPVDFAGQTADLERVREIADSCGAKVIQDAAHSLGARAQQGESWVSAIDCRFSHAAILSFHPVKHITTAEGGAVVTNDEGLAETVRELRSHGIHKHAERFVHDEASAMIGPWYYEQDRLGYNYRITDLQCALGISQLRRLPDFVARRREVAAAYDQALSSSTRLAGRLVPLAQRSTVQSSYHLYVVTVQEVGASLERLAQLRADLYHFLRERQIFPQVHYVPVPWQPFHGAAPLSMFPKAAAYYASCLSLPMFPAMEDTDLSRVVSALESWVEGLD